MRTSTKLLTAALAVPLLTTLTTVAGGNPASASYGTPSTYLVEFTITTNDGFGGIDSRGLPRSEGRTRNYPLRAFDAGTEINTELRADLVGAPFCGEGAGSGESNPDLAENGVIKRHRTLRGVGDLDAGLDWSGPVAKVTITNNG